MKKSDVSLLLIALGIIAAVCSYFFVYTKFNEKTEVLEASNATLRTEVQSLEELEQNRAEYEAKTADWNTQMDEIKTHFDASYLPEDEILYVNDIENRFSATMASVSMPGSSLVDVAYTPATLMGQGAPAAAAETEVAESEDGEEEVVVADVAPTTEPPVRLYSTPVSITYQASYDSVKALLDDMNKDDMRKSIDNITMAFDGETGGITGSIAFTMYSMTGTDATYEVPSIPGITFGTKDIFNSTSKGVAIKNAKAAENN